MFADRNWWVRMVFWTGTTLCSLRNDPGKDEIDFTHPMKSFKVSPHWADVKSFHNLQGGTGRDWAGYLIFVTHGRDGHWLGLDYFNGIMWDGSNKGWAGDIRGWQGSNPHRFSGVCLAVNSFNSLVWSLGVLLIYTCLILTCSIISWRHLRWTRIGLMPGIGINMGVIRKDRLGGLSFRCSPVWIPTPMLGTQLGNRNLTLFSNHSVGLGWTMGWDRCDLRPMWCCIKATYCAGGTKSWLYQKFCSGGSWLTADHQFCEVACWLQWRKKTSGTTYWCGIYWVTWLTCADWFHWAWYIKMLNVWDISSFGFRGNLVANMVGRGKMVMFFQNKQGRVTLKRKTITWVYKICQIYTRPGLLLRVWLHHNGPCMQVVSVRIPCNQCLLLRSTYDLWFRGCIACFTSEVWLQVQYLGRMMLLDHVLAAECWFRVWVVGIKGPLKNMAWYNMLGQGINVLIKTLVKEWNVIQYTQMIGLTGRDRDYIHMIQWDYVTMLGLWRVINLKTHYVGVKVQAAMTKNRVLFYDMVQWAGFGSLGFPGCHFGPYTLGWCMWLRTKSIQEPDCNCKTPRILFGPAGNYSNLGQFGLYDCQLGQDFLGWILLKLKFQLGVYNINWYCPHIIGVSMCNLWCIDFACNGSVFPYRSRFLFIPSLGSTVSYFWSPMYVLGDVSGVCPLK
ncbi:hypothetical protein Hanom_Chr15g01337241 [Helianthus anomalus]